MRSLYPILLCLVVFPFLFPTLCIPWLRTVQRWLDERDERDQSETRRLEELIRATKEWRGWLKSLHKQLHRAQTEDKFYPFLAEALAAGQQYLQDIETIDSSEDLTKVSDVCRIRIRNVHQETQSTCQHLEEVLKLSPARQKERG